MTVYEVIDAKKQKRELDQEQIRFFVRAVADGSASDAQIAAFCMAVLLNGMTDEESYLLTDAMAASGERPVRPPVSGVIADKHSTGGVSDSTTLILVPVLCSLGVRCAKYSGRGLGHTGGTLDKLESFPGFRTALTAEEFAAQIGRIGGAVAGQTEHTVPADKRMYAVRDVTATIDSIPLIASSVMSKKLASFADVILLDVKYGDGAFMRTAGEAERLARLMVKIGARAGRKVSAAVTNMDAPLGDAIGCNAEVREAVAILGGKRNALAELSLFLAEKLLAQAFSLPEKEARARVEETIASGAALKKLAEIVAAQGGDARAVYDASLLPLAPREVVLRAEKGGVLRVAARKLGEACLLLGGGRQHAEDAIDHTVGIVLTRRDGDPVRAGEEIARVYCRGEAAEALGRARSAFSYLREYRPEKLVYDYIEAEE